MKKIDNINNGLSNENNFSEFNQTKKPEIKKKGLNKFWIIFISQFCGFIGCLMLVAGIGAILYFNVTPKFLNKNFNTNISVNENVDNMPVSKILGKVVNILNNSSTYTLANLKNDFEIDFIEQIKLKSGIDLSELKNVALVNLAEKMDDVQIASLLGYKVDGDVVFEDKNNNNKYNVGIDKQITGTEAVVAKQQIKDLKTKLQNLSVDEVFAESERVGILKLIGADTRITNLGNKIVEVLNSTKIGVLVENGIIVIDNYNANKKMDFGAGEELISDKTIGEILSFLYS